MATTVEELGVDKGKLEQFADKVMGDVGGGFALLLLRHGPILPAGLCGQPDKCLVTCP